MLQRTTLLPLLAALVLVCAAAACRDPDGVGEQVAELGPDDLNVLVLPLDELGNIADGFEIDPGSGPLDNEAAAASSVTPDVTAHDLAALGRVSGYELTYVNPAPVSSQSVLDITTGATLWQDDEAAAESLQRFFEDTRAQEGTEIGGGRLQRVSRFDVDELGDESAGIIVEYEFPNVGFAYGTLVHTQLGRLTLVSGIVSLGSSYEDDADRIARRHLEWVEQVLSGELEREPVAIPDPPPNPTPTSEPRVVPPLDGEALPDVALHADDLPDALSVVGEYLDPAGAGIADFTREFEATEESARIGSSRVVNVQNNIIVFAEEEAAAAFVDSVANLLGGESGADFLRGYLAGEDIVATELTTARHELALGDETAVVIAQAQTDVADFVLAYVLTRTANIVSAFIVVADSTGFQLDDISTLAETVLTRITSFGTQ